MIIKLKYLLVFVLVFRALWSAADDTELMFVGENLEVLTIASGREEGAWTAPAVADVVLRSDIEENGMETLKEVLDSVPGVFTSENEWRYAPFMRGVADSILFMYDAAPLGSKLNKDYSGFDPFLSLAGVKRVEIIRGPGSVLWGSDAFAGIVNIVPMSGRDFQGVETGARSGSDSRGDAVHLNWGTQKKGWDGFGSVIVGQGHGDERTSNLVRFWGDEDMPVPPEDRTGSQTQHRPRYLELTGNAGISNALRLSTRMVVYEVPYFRSNLNENLTWQEKQNVWAGSLKAEGSFKQSVSSGFRWTGMVSWFEAETQIVDLDLDQNEKVAFGEIVHEKSLFGGKGLLTSGVSLRYEDAGGIPVWDSYYPDYFTSNNLSFLPSVEQNNYFNTTSSLFGQYLHKIGRFDIWAGIRGEDHDTSGKYLSYNTGFFWDFDNQWIVKAVYGNAYRTPFAKQIQEEKNDMENIETASIQGGWRFFKKNEISVTFYKSWLYDYLVYDPEAGLSQPGNQNLTGVEWKAEYSPEKSIKLSAGLSLVDCSGGDTLFKYNDYSYFEGGEIKEHYIDLSKPYDPGSKKIFNAGVVWETTDKSVFHAKLRYTGSRKEYYPVSDISFEYPGFWVFDLGLRVSDFFKTGLDVSITGKNIFDHNYDQPGAYGSINGDGAVFYVKFVKHW